MKKLAVMSDLHIDLNHIQEEEQDLLIQILKEEKIDHLHLAGDISNDFIGLSLPFIKAIGKDIPLTFNLGNHDMLGLSEKTIQELDFQETLLSKETLLLSFHGWYDYSFFPEKSFAQNRAFKQQFWFDRRLRRLEEDPSLTASICQKLDQKLSESTFQRIIVSMHFVPHRDFLLTHPKFKPFNAFLGSHKFHDIFEQYPVTDVVFGHNHRRMQARQIDTIYYHSKPLGYQKEWQLTADFIKSQKDLIDSSRRNPNQLYTAIKNRESFQNYKKNLLSQEFRLAMTIIDY